MPASGWSDWVMLRYCPTAIPTVLVTGTTTVLPSAGWVYVALDVVIGSLVDRPTSVQALPVQTSQATSGASVALSAWRWAPALTARVSVAFPPVVESAGPPAR